MLNIISNYNGKKIEYQLDETRIKRKSQHEIKVYLIELVIMFEEEWSVIGKFALTIEFDQEASSFYLMFYNLEKNDILEQEIFIPMFKYHFDQTEFLLLQTDEYLILLNFTCPEEAAEFYEIFSTIYADIFDYYFFNISEKSIQKKLTNQSETDKIRDKLTLKSVLKDVKSLLSHTFNKKITNIKNQGADTTSKIFKGISSKCDNVINKLENNEEKNTKMRNSTMRNSSKVNLKSLPDFPNNYDSIISRSVKNNKNISEKPFEKNKRSSSRIINNGTLSRNQMGSRINSMSNLISSRKKFGISEQSLDNPKQRTIASSIRHGDNINYNRVNKQFESTSNKDCENSMALNVKMSSPIPNLSSEIRNTGKTTKETPARSSGCKLSSEISRNNSNVIEPQDMDLLQQIRNAKMSDLKKPGNSKMTPEKKPFSNLLNNELLNRRKLLMDSDNDSSDGNSF